MNNHYIVLNGKRYDAVTGALLNPEVSEKLPQQTLAKPVTPHAPRDTAPAPKNNPTPMQAPKQPHTPRTSHHITPHSPQHGKTLVRRAVKPEPIKKVSALKKQYPLQKTMSDVMVGSRKLSAATVDTARLARAKSVSKSKNIGHFTAVRTATVLKPVLAPVRVAPAPTSAHTTVKTKHAVAYQPAQKARKNIFEEALAGATSHETAPPAKIRKSHKKQYVTTASFVVALLLVASFLVFNRQAVTMQVASWRAGFSASSPSFIPNGYHTTTTAVEGKSISINFVSAQNRTKYSLTQEPSKWNSSTLLTTIVTQSGSSYRTIQNAGRTIYIYDNGKATWVDGGILYTIAGDTPLSTDQITSIASSL